MIFLEKNGDAWCQARRCRTSSIAIRDERRRARNVIGSCRMMVRYEAARTDDRALRERMKPIAHKRRHFELSLTETSRPA